MTTNQHLTHLETTGLIRLAQTHPELEFIFRHALVQDVAYESLLMADRQVLHRTVAETLEHLYPDRLDELAPMLGHHFARAEEVEKAIDYLLRAGKRASLTSANEEAIVHINKGLALLKRLPDTSKRNRQELELQIALGPALRAAKGYPASEVAQAYTRARELCRQVGETPQILPVLMGLWSYYMIRAEYQIAFELAEQSLHSAQQQEDPALLVMAHQILGGTLCWLGEFSAALTHQEQGIALYGPQHHHTQVMLYGNDFGVLCFALSAKILWILGYPDQALKRIDKALNLAQEVSFPSSLGYAYIMAAWLHTGRREGQAAQKWAKAAITLSTEQGISIWGVWAIMHRGAALAEQGQTEEGIVQMRQGLTAWRTPGAELTVSYSLAQLAKAYGKIGQADEGLIVLAEALAILENTNERFWEAELYRLKGELLLVADQAQKEAESYFYQAIDIARTQGAKSLELRAVMSLSQLWQLQGKQEEAHQILAEIYGWFTEGFDTPDLKEAKALLEELS